ncbi:MAG: CPBP family intramembrane metalloprotease [Oscillospiraceae bacterium]|nr:CPBP family intramembrane metalloprotease [Oscillospiraceae bacterium]
MKELTVKLNRNELIPGWIYYCLQLFVLPIIISFILVTMNPGISDAILNFIFFCINFIAVAIIFHKYLLDNLTIAVQTPLRCLGSAAIGIAAYWLMSIVVTFVIFFIKPDFYNVNDAYIDTMVQEHYGLIAFATVLLVPITEEALYRGLMFGAIYNRNKLAAYLLSTVVFAAVHVIGYIGTYDTLTLALCLLQYLPAGLCLGWAYARSNSIWAPILMHISINLISMSSMR